jgi:hypothetical protein
MIKLKIKINQKNNMSRPSKLTIWSWDHVKKQNEQNMKLNYQNNQYWKAKLEKKRQRKHSN